MLSVTSLDPPPRPTPAIVGLELGCTSVSLLQVLPADPDLFPDLLDLLLDPQLGMGSGSWLSRTEATLS